MNETVAWYKKPPKFVIRYLKRSHWHGIRSLGSSSIVKISIVAPVVGYLILATKLDIVITESWKFYLFYIGMFCISIGTAIYAWKCPGLAKKYDTAVEYAAFEADFFTANPIIIEKNLKKALKKLRKTQPDIEFDLGTIESRFEIAKSGVSRELRRDAIIYLMDQLWHAQNYARELARVSCRVFYDIGTMMVIAPSVWTFVQILARLFS